MTDKRETTKNITNNWAASNKVVCHGCNGKGWVSTDDNKTTRVPENNPDVLDWIEEVRE